MKIAKLNVEKKQIDNIKNIIGSQKEVFVNFQINAINFYTNEKEIVLNLIKFDCESDIVIEAEINSKTLLKVLTSNNVFEYDSTKNILYINNVIVPANIKTNTYLKQFLNFTFNNETDTEFHIDYKKFKSIYDDMKKYVSKKLDTTKSICSILNIQYDNIARITASTGKILKTTLSKDFELFEGTNNYNFNIVMLKKNFNFFNVEKWSITYYKEYNKVIIRSIGSDNITIVVDSIAKTYFNVKRELIGDLTFFEKYVEVDSYGLLNCIEFLKHKKFNVLQFIDTNSNPLKCNAIISLEDFDKCKIEKKYYMNFLDLNIKSDFIKGSKGIAFFVNEMLPIVQNFNHLGRIKFLYNERRNTLLITDNIETCLISCILPELTFNNYKEYVELKNNNNEVF